MENNNDFKDITLEQLAHMVANGFAQTATKEELKAVETRLDNKIDNLEAQLTTKIDGLGRRLDQELTKRLEIEKDFHRIKEHIGLDV